MIEVACKKCNAPMRIDGHVYEIVNQKTFSAIILNHAAVTGNVCASCGEKYMIVINGFDPRGLQTLLIPAPPEPEPSRIISLN